MTQNPILVALITGVMSGGIIGALTTLWVAWKKTPVERDSIIVGGAETAVLALEKSLAAEIRRADRAEAREAQKDAQLERMREQLEAAQATLDQVRAELHELLKKPQ